MIETRSAFTASRAAGAPAEVVSGVGLPFGERADIAGVFLEQFAPNAFADQEASAFAGVMACWWHDAPSLLGTVDGGSLRVTVERAGLMYELRLPQSCEYAAEMVGRGDVAGASIGFSATNDAWSQLPDGRALRTVLSARLIEVSLVATPAYRQTTARLHSARAARHLQAVPSAPATQLRAPAAAPELSLARAEEIVARHGQRLRILDEHRLLDAQLADRARTARMMRLP